LGNLIADIFAESVEADVMLVGSGSIRSPKLGPVVTLSDFRACFPYDDSIVRYSITGADLTHVFEHIMRNDNRNDEGECYQVNHAVSAVYDTKNDHLISLTLNGSLIDPHKIYTIAMQGYHATNCHDYLDVSSEKIIQAGPHKVATTSAQQVLEEYLKTHRHLTAKVEGRLRYQ
jgi:5'-nucleotidase